MEDAVKKAEKAEKARMDLQSKLNTTNKKVEELTTNMEELKKKHEGEIKAKEDDLKLMSTRAEDLEEEVKDIEAEATLRMKAHMANEGDNYKKKKNLQNMVDDYLKVGTSKTWNLQSLLMRTLKLSSQPLILLLVTMLGLVLHLEGFKNRHSHLSTAVLLQQLPVLQPRRCCEN